MGEYRKWRSKQKEKKRKDCNKYFEKIQSKAKYLESKGGRVRRAP